MLGKTSVRLNKYISDSGICSRREADRFIEAGAVFLNGKRAKTGDQVGPGDTVRVNGQTIEPRRAEAVVVIALHKPLGVVSTTEPGERDSVVRFINHPLRLFPIGRLDKDSEGLILLTNNGDLVNRILRAGNEHDKEYVVSVDRPVTDAFLRGMAGGVPMLGTRTLPCTVEKLGEHTFRVVLVQGLNRQIRRMCEHFGYSVTRLVRTRIMHIGLGSLPVGDWRHLDDGELAELGRLIEHSSGEAPPDARRPARRPSRGPKPTAAASEPPPRGKPKAAPGRPRGPAAGKSRQGPPRKSTSPKRRARRAAGRVDLRRAG